MTFMKPGKKLNGSFASHRQLRYGYCRTNYFICYYIIYAFYIISDGSKLFIFFWGGGAIIESCEVDEFLHITYFFQQIYWLYIIDFWDVFFMMISHQMSTPPKKKILPFFLQNSNPPVIFPTFTL